MKPSLSSAVTKLLLVVVIVSALLYLRVAWRQYSSHRLAHLQSIEGVRAACAADPSDAENFQLLGAYQLNALEPDLARESLHRASELNPWDARTWLTLATIYGISGDDARQQTALDAAYSADPKTPQVAWEVANFYLVRGENAKALRFFRTIVENSPESRQDAFRLSWQSTHDIDMILADMIPPSQDAHLKLLSFLIQENEADGAAKVWQKLMQSGQSIPGMDAGKYIDFLVGRHELSAAKRVSAETNGVSTVGQLRRGDNLVINGDFEEPISGAGFDWHYTPNAACKASIDQSEGKTGTHSLSVEVKGSFGDVGAYQYVPVTPGRRYDLSAFIRSEDIQSSSGPRIGVYDAYTNEQYGVTEDILESSVWRQESLQFTAGPSTELVIIRLVRVPAGPQIKGKFWVDDIRLTER